MENKNQLIKILEKQNSILDDMLQCQTLIHDDVMKRNWVSLEEHIQAVKICTDSFVEQDELRESIAEKNSRLYYAQDVAPLFAQVRSKLSRSKIENEALSSYVNATRSFVDGVIRECIPQDRNVLYSPKGIRKSYSSSVVINTVL